MSLSALTLSTIVRLAEEANHAPAIHPYVLGAGVLVLLLALLGILLVIGGGREHS